MQYSCGLGKGSRPRAWCNECWLARRRAAYAKRKTVSEAVDAKEVLVSDEATDTEEFPSHSAATDYATQSIGIQPATNSFVKVMIIFGAVFANVKCADV